MDVDAFGTLHNLAIQQAALSLPGVLSNCPHAGAISRSPSSSYWERHHADSDWRISKKTVASVQSTPVKSGR